MRLFAHVLACVLAFSSLGLAQTPAPVPPKLPDVHFPNPPAPKPVPVPVGPGSAFQLKQGVQYVITSSAQIQVIASPAGVLTVSPDVGPLRISGVFSDGTGSRETRTYKQPFLYIVEATATGGTCELIAVSSLTDPAGVTRQAVTTDTPAPVPGPGPGPTPGPTPPPAGSGAWAVVVFDQKAPTIAQGQVIDGPTLTALRAAGKSQSMGNVDDAAAITSHKYDVVMQRANVQAPAVLVLDKDGKPVSTVKLPATDAELATFLKGMMQP